jgi:hypothetical protein
LVTPDTEAPAKRDVDKIMRQDGKTTTSKSKGKWYVPVSRDARKDSGPRIKNYKAKWANEKTKATMRNTMPGAAELLGLGKGLYESVNSTYDIEEKRLIESNSEIRRLVETLEKNSDASEDKTQ